ncbi:concanavalin A-like lectin/glucanase domain-containing protein [Lasiosphaeria hispida]|uniref:chitinase n=1 Tax=Lasiosphaeria hispida TaxID=260671 RepID=A0AAJ0ML96_9PEZI|nr:concanavalin A-like lectin/glucanase domain-containing protein [Lasiosphaeria hispida]
MLLPQSFRSAAVLLASITFFQNAAAQVTTDCFPMNTTCPPDPALGMDIAFNFNQTPKAGTWDTTVGPVTYNANEGAQLILKKQGDSPTLRTRFYFFWGRTEVIMKAATGTGIISSVMFLSDNLDEIDWEFKGGNSTHVFSNYFGKGEPDFHNGAEHAVSGSVHDYHNYTTVWTKDALVFYIDGSVVRTLLPKDANNTHFYPQTPMRLSLGIWAGGDPTLAEGTREWAGGDTDYTKGPFNMLVKSVQVEDYSSGKEYVYGDKTGSWQSIKVVEGNSTVKEEINKVPEPTVTEKFNNLSPTAKIAIYASAAGVGGILVIFALFYCIRQRRRGAREARLAEAKAEQERMELERFRKAGVDPDSFTDQATEYNAMDMRRDGLSDKNSYSVPPTPDEKWEKAAAVGVGAGAGVAAANAMRSPMPLLRDGAQSPRVSPPSSANPFNDPYSDRPTNTRSPATSFPNVSPHEGSHSPAPYNNGMQSPPGAGMGMGMGMGMGAAGQQHPHPATRSFSNPNTQMRGGSPGFQQPGFGGMQRTNSPAQVAQPMPQRSFTSNTGYGGGFGGQQDNGYNNGNPNGGQYWGNGNYR